MTAQIEQITTANLAVLSQNPYPGRGLIVGRNETGKNVIQVYWLTGRRPSSRNRVLSHCRGRVFTEVADLSLVKEGDDFSLTLYNAMEEIPHAGIYVVSNGRQTDTVIANQHAEDLNSALLSEKYEPDPPINTPRITGKTQISSSGEIFTELSILHEASSIIANDVTVTGAVHFAHDSKDCMRLHYAYEDSEIPPGYGYGITTYSNDGNPPPAFNTDPLLLPLKGNMEEIALSYWNALDADNRVALVVKSISLKTGQSFLLIMNRYRKLFHPDPEDANKN